jgi:ubiquinone biosynthesis monooxygenase Coq7
LESMLRVDHAGELGADAIYCGQMAVLGRDPRLGPLIQVQKRRFGSDKHTFRR